MAPELPPKRDRGSDIYLLLGLLRTTPPSAGLRGYLLPLCFVVLGNFPEAQLRGQQFPCWKVTCKCLSASGPIFFSFQCYWLSEEIRTEECNILCVADRKFFIHAVLEIRVGSKTLWWIKWMQLLMHINPYMPMGRQQCVCKPAH